MAKIKRIDSEMSLSQHLYYLVRIKKDLKKCLEDARDKLKELDPATENDPPHERISGEIFGYSIIELIIDEYVEQIVLGEEEKEGKSYQKPIT